MPTRNVVVTDHQHELIDRLVASGRYQNASEVLREGIRLIEERDRLEAEKLAALRKAADQGWDDELSGRYVDLGEDELADLIGQLRHSAHIAKP